jgi:hypothetical protein
MHNPGQQCACAGMTTMPVCARNFDENLITVTISTGERDRMSGGVTRATAWLTAWDSQGIHRTATAGDAAGAEWLTREAADLGAAPALEEFVLDRLDPVEAYLELDNTRIPAVPVFDAPATGPDGVSGILGRVGEHTPIAVAELSPLSVYTPDYYEQLRCNVVHHGLAILCKGSQSGLGLLNAERFRHPYGAPAVLVSSEARAEVLAAAARRTSARLLSTSRRVPTRASNVVVMFHGRDRSRTPVVVMTPRSSWWQSTSERGGGLVCWLESLRALVASPPPFCDVIFTANGGHELGHLGLDDFMTRRPGWERPVAEGGAVWVHYGANIGAVGGELSIQSASDDLRAMATAELTRAGHPPHIAPKTLVPSGETRDIHRAGGCYVTLVGTNPLFHLPQDRWPHAVDPGAVASVAAAAAGLVVRLTH